jgi:hypothetical protein
MYAITLALLCQLPPAMPPLPVSANLPAMQVAEPDAPAALTPAAGVFPGDQNAENRPGPVQNSGKTHVSAGDHQRFYVAAPRPVQSCAGGVCQPAAQGPRYQYQSRSSQPRRLLFGRFRR